MGRGPHWALLVWCGGMDEVDGVDRDMPPERAAPPSELCVERHAG